MPAETLPAKSPFYTPEHLAFRDAMRRFVAREISPHVDAWDEAESFPVDLYRKAAEIGLLGLGFPQSHGGNDGDLFMTIIFVLLAWRCGAAAINAKETMGASMLLGFPDWIVFTSMCIPFGSTAFIAAMQVLTKFENNDKASS